MPIKKTLQKIDISKLKPFSRNPRNNDAAVSAVEKSIKNNGYISPIIVDENFEILAGHTRAKALKKAGIKDCEVLQVEGLTAEQKKDFRIRDNKTGEIAEWDFGILSADFTPPELADFGFDFNKIKDNQKKDVILHSVFEICISAESETEQKEIYEKLVSEGYQCRILTL